MTGFPWSGITWKLCASIKHLHQDSQSHYPLDSSRSVARTKEYGEINGMAVTLSGFAMFFVKGTTSDLKKWTEHAETGKTSQHQRAVLLGNLWDNQ
ncbi:hypothetical protein Pelo_18883 [Pelomyxa schiedti]|nr:hypothetical protein Pelo_18883 [Pelomyxa schiedti]